MSKKCLVCGGETKRSTIEDSYKCVETDQEGAPICEINGIFIDGKRWCEDEPAYSRVYAIYAGCKTLQEIIITSRKQGVRR